MGMENDLRGDPAQAMPDPASKGMWLSYLVEQLGNQAAEAG